MSVLLYRLSYRYSKWSTRNSNPLQHLERMSAQPHCIMDLRAEWQLNCLHLGGSQGCTHQHLFCITSFHFTGTIYQDYSDVSSGGETRTHVNLAYETRLGPPPDHPAILYVHLDGFKPSTLSLEDWYSIPWVTDVLVGIWEIKPQSEDP